MRRYGLRDDQWDRIKDILPGREGHVGGTAADNRLFVEAVLFRFRAGVPWRDPPERFGDWKIVYQRFNRWAKSGVFERVFRLLASDHDDEYMMIRKLPMGRTTIVIAPPGPGYGKAIRESLGRAPTALKGIAAGFGFLDLARFDRKKPASTFRRARLMDRRVPARPADGRAGVDPARRRTVWEASMAERPVALKRDRRAAGAGSSAADFEALIVFCFGQAVFGVQVRLALRRALARTMSFRMTAVRASFAGFPAALRRS